MSCTPTRPCDPEPAGLQLQPPPPGQARLDRRVGEFHGFLEALIAATERQPADDGPLGRRWDVEGDPHASLLAELWAFVAEGVAAYTELTAGEAYLATAADWTDLRRLAALVGYRPRPRIAAQGWVQAEIDKGASPLVPAGTRVQSPGTPERASQTYEVIADTQLRADWANLTATLVPTEDVPAPPDERRLRFLGDPGFRAGDRVLFVLEQSIVPPLFDWFGFWRWLSFLTLGAPAAATALAITGVVSREQKLGTSLVEFDRELDELLSSPIAPYAAYRVRATAGSARRVEKVLQIPAKPDKVVEPLDLTGDSPIGEDGRSVVLDGAIEDLSAGQLVALVNWSTKACDVVRVEAHKPVRWEVAPGTPIRASQLEFADPVGALTGADDSITIYVLDRRVVARHYSFPESGVPGPTKLRLYPEPAVVPERVSVLTESEEGPTWEVLSCSASAEQEPPTPGQDMPRGLIVDLVDGAPAGALHEAPANANLVRVRHGSAARATLGSGDATQAGQRFDLPDAPVAYDLDDAGNPVPSQDLRVEGVHWDELPSLYGTGPALGFVVRLGEDGGVTVEFGDGRQGARLPTGRGNVTATYRVGGGREGEVESGAIDSLLGSVRGVKKVLGAGPTSGGADQDDPRRLRTLAPTRARAFGRAVSAGDLVDLALGFPGVTHAAAWTGTGPPGCPCGRSGLHLGFLRAGASGPRPPLTAELTSLSSYLDGRRDATVALCLCAGVVSEVALEASLAVDPRLEPDAVAGAAKAALADPVGPLASEQRALAQALDRSDVLEVIHGVSGVFGVHGFALEGAAGKVGRREAERWELLLLEADPAIEAAPA